MEVEGGRRKEGGRGKEGGSKEGNVGKIVAVLAGGRKEGNVGTIAAALEMVRLCGPIVSIFLEMGKVDTQVRGATRRENSAWEIMPLPTESSLVETEEPLGQCRSYADILGLRSYFADRTQIFRRNRGIYADLEDPL